MDIICKFKIDFDDRESSEFKQVTDLISAALILVRCFGLQTPETGTHLNRLKQRKYSVHNKSTQPLARY